MFVLRTASISLLLLFLLDILIKQFKNETQVPLVLVAIDNSASMVLSKDSSEIKNKLFASIQKLKNSSEEKFETKIILFGSSSKLSSAAPDFSEKETDIQNLISDVENNYSGSNVGAMVLISDGIYNKGANPRYSVEKLGFPVFCVATGDTSEQVDLSITKINHNQFAYIGNVFPAEVMLRAKKLQGKSFKATVEHNGMKLEEKTVTVSSSDQLSTLQFTFNAAEAGIQKYRISLSVLEGEKNSENNSQSFVIDIIDSRYKVLLMASSPHPDLAAINSVISVNSSYELKTVYFTDPKENLKAYDLIILHGHSNAQFNLYNEIKNLGLPVMIISPQTTDNLGILRISNSLSKQNDAEPAYNKSFGLFGLSDELKLFLNEFPAVKTPFGNYNVGGGIQVLLAQKLGAVETDDPLLAFSDLNGQKIGVFTGDGLWRWKLRDFAEHNNTNLFNELITKCVQYLAIKNDKSLFRLNAPRTINENENAIFSAEVYNKSYEPITIPDVFLTLFDKSNKQFNYTFSKQNSMYRLDAGILPEGEYRYEAKATVNGDALSKKGTFIVKEVMAEKMSSTADHNLLYNISENTGGKMFYLRAIDQLKDSLITNKNVKPITYSTQETSSLTELKWLFYLLLFFFGTEWFFRKRYTGI
jgi:hypothetical protein